MTDTSESPLRGKKIGIIIREVRELAGKSVEESSQVLGIDSEEYSSYELGEVTPSLPELEALADYFNFPIEILLRKPASLQSSDAQKITPNYRSLISLRTRVVGTLIRKARLDADLSLGELSNRVNLSHDQLESYELSEQPIPLPVLEDLARVLNHPMEAFQSSDEAITEKDEADQSVAELDALSPELQEFISNSMNHPYLELAVKLSKMQADELRSIAEGILEITL